MSTGKPQQAAGQGDSSSDDLIAELARLMASDAKSEKTTPAPTAPQAPVAAAPAAEPRVPGTFRIPGMTEPPLVAPPSPPVVPPMRPSDAPAAVASAPPAQVEPSLDDKPRLASPMPAFAHLATPSPIASKSNFAPRVNIAGEAEKKPAAGNPMIEPFKFDFGVVAPAAAVAPPAPRPETPPPAFRIPGEDLGARQQPAQDRPSQEQLREPEPVDTPDPASDEDGDPIADLIAAELTAAVAPAEDGPEEGGFVLRPAPAVSRPVTTPVAPRPQPAPTPTGAAPNPLTAPFQPSRLHAPEPKPQLPVARDSFGSSPVFGLGDRPAPRDDDSAFGSDPIDEIESLIGEAVRVELSAPPRQTGNLSAATPAVAAQVTRPLPSAPQQAPVVPPLNAGFAPRRAGIKDKPTDEEVHAAAEEAILAAAAATGAEVGRLRNVDRDRSERVQADKRQAAPRKIVNMRPLIGLAVAGTLLLAAGFGLYWVLGMGHSDGNAPVLAADTSPVKQAPPPVAVDTEAPRSVVMDEISGVASTEGEQLVSRDQSADEAVTAPPASDDTESGLANRKVRTVTVRPDGTIVSSDDAVAGSTQLPVDRPNVPEMPAASLNGSDLLQATPGATPASSDPIGAMVAETDPNAAVPPAQPAPGAIIDPTLVPPSPAPRIVSREAALARQVTAQPTNPVNAVVNSNGLATAPGGQTIDLLGSNQQPSQAQAQPAASSAPAYVQLSSQRSEGEAQAAAQNILNRFGSLFGGQQLEIRRVDLGAKGIYHRVRLPANSLQEAAQICNSVKANGGDCFAVNG